MLRDTCSRAISRPWPCCQLAFHAMSTDSGFFLVTRCQAHCAFPRLASPVHPCSCQAVQLACLTSSRWISRYGLRPWPQQKDLQQIKTIGNCFVTCDDIAGMTHAWRQEGCYVPGNLYTLPALLPQMLGPWLSRGSPWRAALARAHPWRSCKATLGFASTMIDQTRPGPAC
jgi:hypothetical protein